jgi:hypothetical protein
MWFILFNQANIYLDLHDFKIYMIVIALGYQKVIRIVLY